MASCFAKSVSRGGGFQWRTLNGTCTGAGGPCHLKVPSLPCVRRTDIPDGRRCGVPLAPAASQMQPSASPSFTGQSSEPVSCSNHQTCPDQPGSLSWSPQILSETTPPPMISRALPCGPAEMGVVSMFPRVTILTDMHFAPRFRQERPARAWLPSPRGLPARTPGGGGQTRPAAIWRFLLNGSRTVLGWTVRLAWWLAEPVYRYLRLLLRNAERKHESPVTVWHRRPSDSHGGEPLFAIRSGNDRVIRT